MSSKEQTPTTTKTTTTPTTTKATTLLDDIFKSIVFPGQAFRGILESLMLIYNEEYAKVKEKRKKTTIHLNFQKMNNSIKAVGGTAEEAKRYVCAYGWLQIIIGDNSPGISSVDRLKNILSFPSSTRNASDLKLFATMKMCTMRLAKNMLILSKHENGVIVALLSSTYLKSVNEKHNVCYPLIVEYKKTMQNENVVYVQTQESRSRGHLESVLKFTPYCREIMIQNLIRMMPTTGLMHILYDLRGPAPSTESRVWGKSSYGNMSVAEFDLVMRNEDVVFLNNQGKTFSLYRAGVPENTTFQEEYSLRSYLEIMRFNDADSTKNVDLILREKLVRVEDPRDHVRVDAQKFRLIVRLGTLRHVATLTLGYREKRASVMNNDDSSVRTTSSTNNNVVQKRGTWTRYNGGIHCYTNNRLITMFERIGFQRFFAEIPGHEVFGVLEADFLPVKAAWIEYERRSVLFQLVMKAMRMAVHKYYYEIQTTYTSSLTTKLRNFKSRGSKKNVTIDIEVSQDKHTVVRLASLRRTARRHSREIFYRRIQTSTGYFKSRHPLLTTNYDGCVERDAYQKLLSRDKVNVAVAAAGQMASLDRTIQCAVIQHDGSVCLQEANEPYGTWTVLRPSLNLRVRCVCKQGPAAWMIQCNICSFWCHGMCEGFSHDNRPSSFACTHCRNLDPTLDSEDARPRFVLKNHRHRRLVVELLILENEAPNGAFNIPTGRRQWISDIQSISSLKELRDRIVQTEGLINLKRVPSRIRNSWLQRRAEWRTRLLSLRRPKLTSLVSAVDELRTIVVQIPFCDVCGSGVYNDLNPIVHCANIYNCAKEHWRHVSCLKRITELESAQHGSVWYCETCIHGPCTLSDMTTTIANAKQVKIDMQRRVEMNSKRNDTADMNSSQKLQQSQFRQHAMMTMASTGVTTTTTTTTIAKNNTAYPHVSIIKKEKDAVPVPVIFPVIPKQHKKPPYAQNRHLLRKAKKFSMIDTSKKPHARFLPKYDFANVFCSAASSLLKLSRAGDDVFESSLSEDEDEDDDDVVVLDLDVHGDQEPPSKRIKSAAVMPTIPTAVMPTIPTAVMPTVPRPLIESDENDYEEDMKRTRRKRVRTRKKLLRLMGTAKTTTRASKLMFRHQWTWQFTCDECQFLNSISPSSESVAYSCEACGSSLEMPTADRGRRVRLLSGTNTNNSSSSPSSRNGVIIRMLSTSDDEKSPPSHCLVQLDTNKIVRLALRLSKTYLISVGIGSSIEVLRWTCVHGLRDGSKMSNSMWNFDWCAGIISDFKIQSVQPGSNEMRSMHKVRFLNGDCEWLDLSPMVV